jgi:hypothetical protein
MTPERRLRAFQIGYLAFTLPVLWLILQRRAHATAKMALWGECFILFFVIYSVWSGFHLQKKIVDRIGKPGYRRSPLKTWQAGHLIRLASAVSVCLWAVVLQLFGGPMWLVYFVFGAGVILLLICRPGVRPVQPAE